MVAEFGWTGCKNCLALYFTGPYRSPPFGEAWRPPANGHCVAAGASDPTSGGLLPGPHVGDAKWKLRLNDRNSAGIEGNFCGFRRCKFCLGAVHTGGASPLKACVGRRPRREVHPTLGPILVQPHHIVESENPLEYCFPTSFDPRHNYIPGWATCGRCGLIVFSGDGTFNGKCLNGDTHHATGQAFGVEYWAR